LNPQNILRIKNIEKKMNDPDENEDQEYRIDEIESMHLINSFEEVNLTDPFPSKV